MFNPEKLLGDLVGQALGGVFGGKRSRNPSLLKSGDLAGKATLGLGAIGVAIAAYEHFQKNRSNSESSASTTRPTPPAMPTAVAEPVPSSINTPPPAPPPAPSLENLSEAAADAVLLVRAMIAAAAADGRIDDNERQRILARSSGAGLDAETRRFLEAELAVPKSADEIGAMTRPALVNEVYAAALLAVDIDHETERQFLQRLATALGLSADARHTIESELLT